MLLTNGMDERDPLTERIIACAMALHRSIGPGLKESVYQRGLEIEFEVSGIAFIAKPQFPVMHRGRLLGNFFPDFIVENQVIVEVKSVSAFDRVFEAQVLTYLRVSQLQRALLLNFGRALMRDGVHRFVRDWRPCVPPLQPAQQMPSFRLRAARDSLEE